MSKQFLDLPGLTTYHNNMKEYIPTQVPQSDWNQTTNTAKDYIKNKPTLGTASSKDVATTGNASTTQVVMGNDTRVTDEPNLRAAFDALGLSVVNGMVCQTFTS